MPLQKRSLKRKLFIKIKDVNPQRQIFVGS